MDADVTVVTLTCRRPRLLHRAVRSVRAQDFPGSIAHLVIADDCAASIASLEGAPSFPNRLLVTHLEPRAIGEAPSERPARAVVYPRVARLLNLGAGMARSRWLAFLDDDNEYEPDHIRTLVACANRHRAAAVHSFRRVFHADGRPYLDAVFPWARDPGDGARIYELMCERGVWVRHSNILKDRAGPWGLTRFRNSTIQSANDPVFMVDTSVWLLDRDLQLVHSWPEQYTTEHARDNAAPDDLLLEVLLKAGVRIVASGRPTLRYYLGGISN